MIILMKIKQQQFEWGELEEKRILENRFSSAIRFFAVGGGWIAEESYE